MTIRSRYKLRLFVLVMFAGIFTYLFMPQSWHDRMSTIVNIEEDQSASTRLVQWQYAIDIAHERPFFANGFHAFFAPAYQQKFLAGEIETNQNRSVHSIYFEVLGEHGYPGIFMFLLLGYMAIRYSHRLGRQLQKVPATRDFGDMLFFMQFSFVAFAVNGLTINVAHMDIYWFYLALLYTILRQLGDTIGDVDEFIRQSAKPPKFGLARPLAAGGSA